MEEESEESDEDDGGVGGVGVDQADRQGVDWKPTMCVVLCLMRQSMEGVHQME